MNKESLKNIIKELVEECKSEIIEEKAKIVLPDTIERAEEIVMGQIENKYKNAEDVLLKLHTKFEDLTTTDQDAIKTVKSEVTDYILKSYDKMYTKFTELWVNDIMSLLKDSSFEGLFTEKDPIFTRKIK